MRSITGAASVIISTIVLHFIFYRVRYPENYLKLLMFSAAMSDSEKGKAEKGEEEIRVFRRFEEYLEIMPKDAFAEEITEENFAEWLEKHVEDQSLLNDPREVMEFNEMDKLILMEILESHLKGMENASVEEEQE